MASLPSARETARRLSVEDGAERDQLLDPTRPLLDEEAHSLDVTEACPCSERVGQVEIGGVLVGPEHCCHAALGPPGGRDRELCLGDHTDRKTRISQPDRHRQPGDAAADDDDVHAAFVEGTSRCAHEPGLC